MPTIFLVRHGLKESQRGNPALTSAGKLQAQQTAAHLKQFPISLIVSSPLLRTQQTAEAIAKEFHLPIVTSDLLKERANWGDDPHQSFESFLKEWTTATHDRTFQPQVGDSSQAAGQRLETEISTLLNDQHSHIVLVTHGGIISDFLRNIFGDQQLTKILDSFPYGQDYRINECSITELQVDHHQFELVRLADIKHLS